MALNKEQLKTALAAIFAKSNSADEAASQIANAIDTYVKGAVVVVNTGIPVQVAPSSGTGATTSQGSGSLT